MTEDIGIQMTKFMIFEKRVDGTLKGLGEASFQVTPHKGDHIAYVRDEDGAEYIYEVQRRILTTESELGAGDLIVEYLPPQKTDFPAGRARSGQNPKGI